MRQRTTPASDEGHLGDTRSANGRFPPISISLPHFIKGGSDREFRQLIYALTSLSLLMGRNRQRFAAYMGVSDPQYIMIALIAETPGVTIGKVAEQLSVSSQFVTIEVGKLVKNNIVEKRPNERDRRSMILNLTAKGKNLLRELAPLRRKTNDLMFRSLTEERAKVLKEIISTLIIDGTSALHELDAPHLRGKKAVSA